MRGKAHNGRALTLAQLTRGTADVVALCCWADNDGPAGRCGGVLGGGRWQHYYYWAGIVAGQHVGVGQIIGRQIDGEAPCVGMADPCDAGRVAVVAVSKPAPAGIGRDQLAELYRVNGAVNLWEVASLIVAPQLAGRHAGHGGHKLAP